MPLKYKFSRLRRAKITVFFSFLTVYRPPVDKHKTLNFSLPQAEFFQVLNPCIRGFCLLVSAAGKYLTPKGILLSCKRRRRFFLGLKPIHKGFYSFVSAAGEKKIVVNSCIRRFLPPCKRRRRKFWDLRRVYKGLLICRSFSNYSDYCYYYQ